MRSMQRISLLFLLCFSFLHSFAQTYPVQVNLTQSGPHYNYLAHLSDENNHLQVIATLIDFNAPPVNAQLRFRIKGNGFELTTNPAIDPGASFVLEPGMPTFLNGFDLQAYFQEPYLQKTPANLDLGNLPGGLVEVYVDVVRASNKELLSTNNFLSFIIDQVQPATPSFPFCGSNQLVTDPTSIIFQWQAPQGYIWNGMDQVTSEFYLYENPDDNNAFASNQIYPASQQSVNGIPAPSPWLIDYATIQNNETTYSFQPFSQPLTEGKTYTWWVKTTIFDINGNEIVIANNGLSPPCSFMYGESLTIEEILSDGLYINLDTEGSGERKGRAFWTVIDNTPGQGLNTFNDFLVQYRKKPTGNEDFSLVWFEDTVPSFSEFLYQLTPSTTYEVKVSGIVGDYITDPSNISEFTTLDEREYNCGDQDLPALPDTYEPLAEMIAGNVVHIGQFNMLVSEITPQAEIGRYSGTGTVTIPFLGFAQAKVRYSDILIDTEYTVREGQVNVITDGLDNWLDEQYQQFIDPHYVEGVIDSISVDTTAGVAWVTVDGVSLQFEFNPPTQNLEFRDENGFAYTVTPTGLITVSSYLDVAETWVVTSEEVLQFAQNSSEVYGFDGKQYMAWHENYDVMKLIDTTHYFVANKSLAKGQADVVDIVLPSNGNTSFSFEIPGYGTPTLSGTQLTIPAIPNTGKQKLIVRDNDGDKIGQLTLYVYSPKERKVIVVPVASALSQSDIQTTIDATFKEANINVTVEVTPTWNDAAFTSSAQIELPSSVGALNKYSDQMRALRDAYFKDNTLENDAYYLFVVNSFDSPDEEGYMVRGKALGFIKQGASAKTYAHELAHGLGALEHSWKWNGPDSSSTENLMDYGAGINLTKAQWKELRDVDVLPSLWDDVEDGQSISFDISYLEPLKDDSTFTFFTVNGRYITLPETINAVSFSTLDRFISGDGDEWLNERAPIGALIAFWDKDGYIYSTDNEGIFRPQDINTGETLINSPYVDILSNYVKPSAGITAFLNYDVTDGELKKSFFKVPSPIAQTDYAPMAADMLNKFIIFETSSSNKENSTTQFINNHRIGSAYQFDLELTEKLGNSQIDITFNKSALLPAQTLNTLQLFDIFSSNGVAEEVSVNKLLTYLQLINLKPFDYQAFAACIDSISSQENALALNISHLTSQMELHPSVDFRTIDEVDGQLEDQGKSVLIETIKSAYTATSPDELNNLRTTITEGTSDDIGNWIRAHNSSLCAMNGLELSDRIIAFHKLIQDDWNWDVIPELIETIPDNYLNYSGDFLHDISYVNNQHWLEIVDSRLNDSNGDQTDLNAIYTVGHLFTQLISKNPSHPSVQSTQYTKNLYNSLLSNNTATITYNALNQPIYFAKNKGSFDYQSGNQGTESIRVNFQNGNDVRTVSFVNGKIRVTQEYELYDGTLSAISIGSSHSKTEMYIAYDLNPYELVSVVFLENYAEELGKNAGDKVIVPAFYLLLYEQGIYNDDFWDTVTDVIDFVAIVAAPFTLGESLALLTITAAIVNQYMQQERELATTDELSAFEAWDKLYMVVGLIEGAAAIPSMVRSMPTFLIRQKALYKNLADLPPTLMNRLSNVRKYFKGLTTIDDLTGSLNTSQLTFNQLIDDVIALGDDLQNITSWISANDNFIDVVIHSNNNGTFSVLIDQIEFVLSPAELANELKNLPSDKTIRLLSCNNSESASELSQILGREIVGSHGEMKLYDNGLIETDAWYKAKPNGSLDEFIPPSNSLSPTNAFVVLKKVADGGSEIFEGARQFVRNNYGQDFLNQITLKYGSENTGALAVIVKRFGDEGANLLSLEKSLDEIASELVRERVLYRHIGSQAGYLDNLKKTGEIPSGYTTYFSADKFDDPIQAISNMQLNSEWTDAVWVAEFNGNQLVDKVEIPKAKWNEADYLEVLTRSFPEWGDGGASQFITKSEIQISKLKNLNTDEVIDFAIDAPRVLMDGAINIYNANPYEFSQAVKRIVNHRTTTGNLTGGNYGYIEGVVNGNTLDNKMWRSVSLNNAQNEIHIFNAISVQGGNGNAWLRITDSEYRMLNKLADDLGGVKGNSYPSVTGEFKIVSENPYCASCQGIIQQFHDMFPNVNLILIDGAK